MANQLKDFKLSTNIYTSNEVDNLIKNLSTDEIHFDGNVVGLSGSVVTTEYNPTISGSIAINGVVKTPDSIAIGCKNRNMISGYAIADASLCCRSDRREYGNAFALGYNAKAYNYCTFSFGSGEAAGEYAVAMGGGNAYGTQSMGVCGSRGSYGLASFSQGGESVANGSHSMATGYSVSAVGTCSHAEGFSTAAFGDYSHAEGRNCIAKHDNSFAWSGNWTQYSSNADGSFNIDPVNGLSGFYIGKTSLAEHLKTSIEYKPLSGKEYDGDTMLSTMLVDIISALGGRFNFS